MFRISIEADCSVLKLDEGETLQVTRALEAAGIAVENIWVEILDEENLEF